MIGHVRPGRAPQPTPDHGDVAADRLLAGRHAVEVDSRALPARVEIVVADADRDEGDLALVVADELLGVGHLRRARRRALVQRLGRRARAQPGHVDAAAQEVLGGRARAARLDELQARVQALGLGEELLGVAVVGLDALGLVAGVVGRSGLDPHRQRIAQRQVVLGLRFLGRRRGGSGEGHERSERQRGEGQDLQGRTPSEGREGGFVPTLTGSNPARGAKARSSQAWRSR